MRKHHTAEQIAQALRQGEAGTPIADIIRKMGVHENTFYLWKKEIRRSWHFRNSRTAPASRRKHEAQKACRGSEPRSLDASRHRPKNTVKPAQ